MAKLVMNEKINVCTMIGTIAKHINRYYEVEESLMGYIPSNGRKAFLFAEETEADKLSKRDYHASRAADGILKLQAFYKAKTGSQKGFLPRWYDLGFRRHQKNLEEYENLFEDFITNSEKVIMDLLNLDDYKESVV